MLCYFFKNLNLRLRAFQFANFLFMSKSTVGKFHHNKVYNHLPNNYSSGGYLLILSATFDVSICQGGGIIKHISGTLKIVPLELYPNITCGIVIDHIYAEVKLHHLLAYG